MICKTMKNDVFTAIILLIQFFFFFFKHLCLDCLNPLLSFLKFVSHLHINSGQEMREEKEGEGGLGLTGQGHRWVSTFLPFYPGEPSKAGVPLI